MPDNKGDESFARNDSDTATFTSPLHVITQYARTDISDIYSLDRSTSLGLCLTNAPNLTDLKSCSLSFHNVSQEVCYQPWTVGSVDTSEFEKFLGRLGNNGSTLTPNSVLNPNNITQDQLFADSASDPFHEIFYPNILSTCDSNSNDNHRMNTEISWVSSLPTISSIANGLRQAVADCGCSATDLCSSFDELSSESRFTNSSYPHKIIGSHRFSENVLASAKDILCSNDDNDGIHCRLSQTLPVLNPCNHEQSDIPVHYAIQEDHGAAQLNGSCSEGLRDDVVTLSSTSRLCTNDSSDFGIRKALTELYYSARPNPSTVEERVISTPALSSVTESTDSNPCSENINRTSAHLFVSCQSTTPRDSSSHLLDNHLNPTSIAGQSPGSSRIHNSDSILSRNDVCLAHPPNSPTNGNLCDQQFDEMYCTLGNQFYDKSLLLQSNSHLIPCISHVCDPFLDAHMLQSLRSPGILSTDLNQVPVNSVLNLTAISSFLSDENNGDLDQRNNYCRRLSNSKSDTVDITSLSTVTSYLNPFSARSLSLVTHSNCLKKPGGGNKKSRFHTLNTNSGLSVVGDSSTDITSIHGIFNDASKSNVKRSRNLRVRGSSDVSCKIHSSVYNDENCSTANPLAYPGKSNKLFTGKLESLVTSDTDDSSNHSESLSTGTRHAVGDSTPVSPSDEVEQHHLKLERKRARNRVAARRCRERKISLIRSLENQVAERDAQVRNLEDAVARYRAESEQLRLHVQMLASLYPSLKAELYHFPFLSQPLSSHSQPPQPQ